jgi:hypothetical protein
MRSDDDTETDDDTESHDEYGKEGDGHIYVDRDKIDFDPEDGLLSGTAVDGTSEIPSSPSNPENEDGDGGDDDGNDGEPSEDDVGEKDGERSEDDG